MARPACIGKAMHPESGSPSVPGVETREVSEDA
jgi:hypothetical protein